jgi:hypothetical protein
MRNIICFLIKLIQLQHVTAAVGGHYDFNGYRYQLANPSVDVDIVDFTGDDCPSTPCPTFQVPSTCNISFSTSNLATIAIAKSWHASFLASTDGIYPVTTWMTSPSSSLVIVDWTTNTGYVALTDFGYQARIVLQCSIPCPLGSVLNGNTCVPCPTGRWAAAGATECSACTNGPAAGVYTSAGAGSNNCSYVCQAGHYSQASVSPFLLIGDQSSIRAVDDSGVVTRLYTAPSTSDPTYGFIFMLVLSSNSQIVFLGTYSINRLNLTSGSYTTVAGRIAPPFRGNLDGTGSSASFNSIVGAVLYSNTSLLLLLDGANCNLRQLTNPLGDAAATSVVVATVVGSTCGFQDGIGIGSRIKYPTDMKINPSQDIVYVSDAGNPST